MKRETLEWKTAKAIAARDEWLWQNEEMIGNFFNLKEYCWKEFCEETFDKNEPQYKFQISKEEYDNLPKDDRNYECGVDKKTNEVFYTYFKYNPEWKKWKRNEINQFAKKFAKKNNIENTKESWFSNSYELSGYFWYESENEYAKYLLENDYFCDLSDEELVEEYYKYA